MKEPITIEEINKQIELLKAKKIELANKFVYDRAYQLNENCFVFITKIKDEIVYFCNINISELYISNDYLSIYEFQDKMELTDKTILDIWITYQTTINDICCFKRLLPEIERYFGHPIFYLASSCEYHINKKEVYCKYHSVDASCLKESTPDEFIQYVKLIFENLFKKLENDKADKREL